MTGHSSLHGYISGFRVAYFSDHKHVRIMTQQGATFYKVRIETERAYFQQRALRYDLVPGVQVATSILTGRRTVLEYLLDPLIGGTDTALRER